MNLLYTAKAFTFSELKLRVYLIALISLNGKLNFKDIIMFYALRKGTLHAFPKSIDSCQPARSAQADMSRNFPLSFIFVAFVEDNATMSSIRYFENHAKPKEADPIKLISLRQISLFDSPQIYY